MVVMVGMAADHSSSCRLRLPFLDPLSACPLRAASSGLVVSVAVAVSAIVAVAVMVAVMVSVVKVVDALWCVT